MPSILSAKHKVPWIVAIALGALVIGGIVVIVVSTSRSYAKELRTYLNAFQHGDVPALKRHVCSETRALLSTDTDWQGALASERRRVGEVDFIDSEFRGEPRLAYFEVHLKGGRVRGYDLRIGAEPHRLVPCPAGTHLLGEPSPD
jgi:hypothetical protein